MIRHAEHADLPAILDIYHTARAYMRKSGNATQWGDGYPTEQLLRDDIRRRQLYVYEDGGTVHGVFMFVIGDEPTYRHIEHGAWQSDAPYGTIHRIASGGTAKGVFAACLAFCKSHPVNLRIDTHANNAAMRHLVQKHGFSERGQIRLEDGGPRIAYEYLQADN